MELGDSCPICQEEMTDPIELSLCKVHKASVVIIFLYRKEKISFVDLTQI